MTAASVAPVAYAVTAAAYAGFQWLVQLVVYRSYDLVPPDAFPSFERRTCATSWPLAVVLFGMLLAVAGLFLADLWSWGATAAVLLAALLGLSVFGAAPLHARLVRGHDDQLLRRLMRIDAARTAVATIQLALAIVLVLT